MAVRATTLASKMDFPVSSNMAVKSRESNIIEEGEREQSHKDTHQKPYDLTPDIGAQLKCFVCLLSRMHVHMIDEME